MDDGINFIPDFEKIEFPELENFDCEFLDMNFDFGFGEDQTTRHLDHEQYRTLIESKEWRRLRRRLLKIYTACQWCGSSDRLECHHLSYNDPLNVEDIVVVCLNCHRQAHRYPDLGRESMPDTLRMFSGF